MVSLEFGSWTACYGRSNNLCHTIDLIHFYQHFRSQTHIAKNKLRGIHNLSFVNAMMMFLGQQKARTIACPGSALSLSGQCHGTSEKFTFVWFAAEISTGVSDLVA
jgi:hypothetical protein